MRSKTSCFNPAIFRKNLTRFWPLWGLASFCGGLFPLALLVMTLRVRGAMQLAADPLEMKEMLYAALAYAVPLVTMFYAILCAAAVWSYLYNAKSVGLMHAIPVTRGSLFVTNTLSGLSMLLIPYAVTGALTILVAALWGGFTAEGFAVTILGVLGDSVFYFGLATFSAFAVGNIIILPLLYFLLNFLAVIADWMVHMLTAGFLIGINSYYSGAVEFLSPTVCLMKAVAPERQWDEATDKVVAVTLRGGWIIAVYAAVGLLLLLLAYLLYRKRRSESAGDVMAVRALRPVFRYGCALFAAILGGRLLYELFWQGRSYGGTLDAIPFAICMIVAGLIGYFLACMMLAKTPRVFNRRSLGGVLAVVIGCVALCAALRFDVFGMERRIPAAERVEEVELYAADSHYYLYAPADAEQIEAVCALHRAIVEDKAYLLAQERNSYADYSAPREEDEDTAWTTVTFTYRLTGGKTLERSYNSLLLTKARMAQSGTYDNLLDALVSSSVMRGKRLHWGDARFRVENATVYFDFGGEVRTLNTDETNAVMAAIRADAESGNWGGYDWWRYAPTKRDDPAAYAVTIEVAYAAERFDEENRVTNTTWDYVTVRLRPEMRRTMETLLSLGVLTDKDLVTREEVYPWEYDDDWDYGAFYEKYGMAPEEYYARYGGYPAEWLDTLPAATRESA